MGMATITIAPTAPASAPAIVRARPLAPLLGAAGVALSLLTMVLLHFAGAGRVDPMTTTLSDYIFLSGSGWLFNASVLSIAVAGTGIALGLGRNEQARGPLLVATLWLAVAGAVLVAVFPTDPGASVSLSAKIHRYSAGVIFFCLPIAASLVAGRLTALPRHRKVLWVSIAVTTVVLGVFLFSQSAAAPESFYATLGLWQRVLFAVELALLAQLANLAVRHRPQPDSASSVASARQPGTTRETTASLAGSPMTSTSQILPTGAMTAPGRPPTRAMTPVHLQLRLPPTNDVCSTASNSVAQAPP
jgi:hypothetical membrane protein